MDIRDLGYLPRLFVDVSCDSKRPSSHTATCLRGSDVRRCRLWLDDFSVHRHAHVRQSLQVDDWVSWR